MVNFMKRESAQPEAPVSAEEPPMPEALTTESLAARGFTVLNTSGKPSRYSGSEEKLIIVVVRP